MTSETFDARGIGFDLCQFDNYRTKSRQKQPHSENEPLSSDSDAGVHYSDRTSFFPSSITPANTRFFPSDFRN